MSRLHVSEAWEQALEDRALTCQTCTEAAEERGPYCLSCRLYWEDVRSGMFEFFPEDQDLSGPQRSEAARSAQDAPIPSSNEQET